ncbi:MAG TPA: Hpt domain-containing protein, partial [Methylomirabilota bacterium]|nr:Hpt domain-containing protein [Methylomirabilota bacterium]
MAESAEQEFLRSIFLMEAWDTVAALEEATVTLARAGGVDDLFVVTHRLKGAAALHGFPGLAALAEEIEEALGARPPDPRRLESLVGHLKRALDTAAGVSTPAAGGAGAASAGREPRQPADEILREAETRESLRPAAAAPAPSAASVDGPAADPVASAFEAAASAGREPPESAADIRRGAETRESLRPAAAAPAPSAASVDGPA